MERMEDETPTWAEMRQTLMAYCRESRRQKTISIMRMVYETGKACGLTRRQSAWIYTTEMVQHGMGDLTVKEHYDLFANLCQLYADDKDMIDKMK